MLTVRGHAGYAPAGQDIVCAAVSTVVAVCEATLDAFGCTWNESEDTAGNAVTVEAAGEHAETVLNVAIETLRQIAREYPEHVAVEQIQRGHVAAADT